VLSLKERKLLGVGVRKYRKRAGLTMEQLAEKADLSPVYVGQIERAFKVPSVECLVRIAKCLNVKAHDLMENL
jgi:transcriptional regulator with XRE-family HTH domain